MSDKDKILTVSYGAFSCRLEGFDDPVDAVRRVTAFFQDVAASDRAFGAAPGAQPSEPRATDTGAPRGLEASQAGGGSSATGIPETGISDEAGHLLLPAGHTDTDLAAARAFFAQSDASDRSEDSDEDELPALPQADGARHFPSKDVISAEGEPVQSVTQKLKRLNAVAAQRAERAISGKASADWDNTPEHADAPATPLSPVDPPPDATVEVATGQAAPHHDSVLDRADAPAVPTPRRAHLPHLGDTAKTDIARLIDRTEQQMAEPEGTLRRNAFSHLRAAVAARTADQSIPEADLARKKEAEGRYKGDLADTLVRAGSLPGSLPDRRLADREPPLRLVAEQRVDSPATATRSEEATRSRAGKNRAPQDFAAFARDMGARELPDLLEAAAAYLTHEEGKQEFTRLQLISCLTVIRGLAYKREDVLRCFGKLLREGRLEARGQGHYSATRNIRFASVAQASG